MTPHREDVLLEELERLAQPDRFLIASFTPDGTLTRMIPRHGGLLPALRRTDALLWTHLDARDAAAVLALMPGEALSLEVPAHGTPVEVTRTRVTVLRRRDDLLLQIGRASCRESV